MWFLVAVLRKHEQLQYKFDWNWSEESIPPWSLCGSFKGVCIFPRYRGKALLVGRKRRSRKKLNIISSEMKLINFVLILSLFYSRRIVKSHCLRRRRGCHGNWTSYHGPASGSLSARIFRRLRNGDSSFYKQNTSPHYPLAFQTSLQNLLAWRGKVECWLAPCRGPVQPGPIARGWGTQIPWVGPSTMHRWYCVCRR